jgi:dienelactone hydrolase
MLVNRLFFSLLFLTVTVIGSAQYTIGHLSTTFTDPDRNNRPIPVEIYYPADAAGEAVPVADGVFPVIQFGHGFVMVWSAYQSFWETYVPEGFIVCFPKSEGTFSPSHLEFGKDLAFLCDAFEVERNNPASLFYNRLNGKYGIMGHSMGGGCSILAAPLNPTRINCVATFAAANTNPSAIEAAANLQVPSLFFAGSYDCITPPAQHALAIFEGIDQEYCKTYINLDGASHCQFASPNANCSLGETLSGCGNPPINGVEQRTRVNNLLLPWLEHHLKNPSQAAFEVFYNQIITPNGFTVINNCEYVVKSQEPNGRETGLRLLENPVRSQQLRFEWEGAVGATFQLKDISGKRIKTGRLPSGSSAGWYELELPVLSPGTYLLYLTTPAGQTFVQRFIYRGN